MKKKLVFISNMAAPYQVKFCYELNKYFNTEFWFYVWIEENRPEWWKINLGKKCKIFKHVHFIRSKKYFTLEVIKYLNSFNPDIVLLGGFFIPSNIIAYYWSIINRKKVYFLTEAKRKFDNKKQKGYLLKKSNKIKVIKIIYSRYNGILTTSADAYKQFTDNFKFNKDKVFNTRYPSDIDRYFEHPTRNKKETLSILFANRLIPEYNPIMAIEIFEKLVLYYKELKLYINATGCLKNDCINAINEKSLKNVIFLEEIGDWNSLGEIYKNCDILLFPAKFSNDNFTIIEAMASGMGIVISNQIKGFGELIINEHNGYKCNNNIDCYVESIKKYIKYPELFRSHSSINREIVEKYKMSELAKDYFSIFSNC